MAQLWTCDFQPLKQVPCRHNFWRSTHTGVLGTGLASLQGRNLTQDEKWHGPTKVYENFFESFLVSNLFLWNQNFGPRFDPFSFTGFWSCGSNFNEESLGRDSWSLSSSYPVIFVTLTASHDLLEFIGKSRFDTEEEGGCFSSKWWFITIIFLRYIFAKKVFTNKSSVHNWVQCSLKISAGHSLVNESSPF